MRIAHELITAVLKRHDGRKPAKDRQPMTIEQLLDWIAERCTTSALRELKILMRDRMRYQNWSIAVGPHTHGGDQNRRITIYVNDKGYHLYLNEQDVIDRVTYKDHNDVTCTPSGIAVWDTESRK